VSGVPWAGVDGLRGWARLAMPAGTGARAWKQAETGKAAMDAAWLPPCEDGGDSPLGRKSVRLVLACAPRRAERASGVRGAKEAFRGALWVLLAARGRGLATGPTCTASGVEWPCSEDTRMLAISVVLTAALAGSPCDGLKPKQKLEPPSIEALDEAILAVAAEGPQASASAERVEALQLLTQDDTAKNWSVHQLCILTEAERISKERANALVGQILAPSAAPAPAPDVLPQDQALGEPTRQACVASGAGTSFCDQVRVGLPFKEELRRAHALFDAYKTALNTDGSGGPAELLRTLDAVEDPSDLQLASVRTLAAVLASAVEPTPDAAGLTQTACLASGGSASFCEHFGHRPPWKVEQAWARDLLEVCKGIPAWLADHDVEKEEALWRELEDIEDPAARLRAAADLKWRLQQELAATIGSVDAAEVP